MTAVVATPKPLVGLTGGIASGKSTVARQLTHLGVAVVDADDLAREVVAKGSEGLNELVRVFGTTLLTRDGELDREALGALVFSDSAARERLNAITHPRIARLSAERIAQAQATDAPYVVYEAALLVETGAYRGMNAMIVIAAPSEVQRARIMSRDGLSDQAAHARVAAQLPLEKKLAVADYVIDNVGDRAALERETSRVHHELMARFGLEPGE